MKLFILLTLALVACGAEETRDSPQAVQAESVNTQLEPEHNMQGPKGDTGSIGPQGPKGDKGDDGERGIDGVNGIAGDDGMPVSPNTWFDPITDDYWLYGAVITKLQIDSADPCGGEFRLPTKEEATSAVIRGLIVAIDNANDRVWTSSLAGTQRYYVNDSGLAPSSSTDSDTATVVCVKL